MITIDDILELEKWIESGDTEAERDARVERAREGLFPRDLDQVEAERRQALIEEVRRRKVVVAEPAPVVVAPPSPSAFVSAIEEEWEGFISRSSAAYMRASLHDGTAQEMSEMRSRSGGSPFNAEDEEWPRLPRRR